MWPMPQHNPTPTQVPDSSQGWVHGIIGWHHLRTRASVSSQHIRFRARRALAAAAAFSCALLFATTAHADSFRWPQPGGPGAPVLLTYSFSNLLDQSFPGALTETDIRSSTAEAFGLWSQYAPLHFVERTDSGPLPSDWDYARGTHPD